MILVRKPGGLTWKNLGVDGKLMYAEVTGWESVYLIDLDQDREECRAVVNTAMDLRGT
jgi:hypothetical protein